MLAKLLTAAKDQKSGLCSMLLRILDVSFPGNLLTGKEVKPTIPGQRVIRASKERIS